MKYDTMKCSIIDGEKICLRPADYADTDLIVNWRNQPFIRDNMIYRKPFTVDGHHEWIRLMIETGKAAQFIILEKTGLRPVGVTFLRDIDSGNEKAEFGVFIGEKDAIGLGYGTEAALLMLDYAFNALKLHKVFLRLISTNAAAEKSYLKAGFIREAYLKDEVKIEGEFVDIILMSKLKDVNPNHDSG
ncbi:MAG: GNAT family N-acetyltransferase [Lachnospiraceae bacterium]|nr:GNAT family N-acetyltransferase [Lachnospiraceae bacterium]